MMQLYVSDYRMVERADIEVSGIALVAGLNGAGKTSLVEAAQAALLGNPTVRAGATKKEARALVRRGADSGLARFRKGDSESSVTWPKCTPATTEGAAFVTPVAAGVTSILDMKDADRASAMTVYLKPLPGKADLAAAMKEAGYDADAADRTWKAIMDRGWDATHKEVSDLGTRLKGNWEATTKDTFGAKKVDGWKPAGMTPEIEAATPEALAEAVEQAQRNLEALVGKGAVDHAERARLTAMAQAGDAIDLDALESAAAAAAKKLEDAQSALAALPAADNDVPTHDCPACKVKLFILTPFRESPILKLHEAVPDSEIKKRRDERAAVSGDLANVRAGAASAAKAVTDAQETMRQVADARQKLGALPPEGDETAIEAGRQAVRDAESADDMRAVWVEASRIAASWARNQRFADILAPDGLRRTRLRTVLDGFNTDLAGLCASAKWPAVRIDEALNIHYGPEPFWNLSLSAQFRVRCTLQVAMAKRDGSDLVLIDAADILDYLGRGGLIRMLHAAGMPAIVTMTMGEPDLAPPLEDKGMGRVYWLADGIATPVAKLKEAA
jgi:hypothetical protein